MKKNKNTSLYSYSKDTGFTQEEMINVSTIENKKFSPINENKKTEPTNKNKKMSHTNEDEKTGATN